MKVLRTKVAVGLVAILAVAASACGDDDTTAASSDQGSGEAESFSVGVILPLTGPASAIGTDFNTALEVFRDIDPVAQGLDIDYVVCDDKTTPEGAASCARKLIQQDDVDMIYGPVIGGTHAGAAPVLNSGPPAITPSPYVDPDEGAPVFSASGTSIDLDQTTLQFAVDRGYTRAAVLATTDLTGETAVENIEQANEDHDLEISVERMGPTDPEASAQLNRLLEGDPEYIYIATSGAAAGVALKGLDQLGADLPTALIWSNTTNGFLEAAGPDFPSETLFAVAPAWSPDTLDDAERAEQVREFQTAFEERAGDPVSFVVQGAYDAFEVIVRALDEAGSDPDAILDHLESLDYQGLNWNLSYSTDNHTGEDSGNYTMMQYHPDTGDWSVPDA